MKYVKLGNSDLKVSRICLGCMGFGDPNMGMHSWTLNEEENRKILFHAFDSGINFLDTAIAYQGGTSEQFVGRAVRDYGKRDDFVIATKFMPRTDEDIASGITAAEHIEKCLHTSLSNLGMDSIDLYILHKWDYNTPIEETLSILTKYRDAGKIRNIGISNAYAWQIAQANTLAKVKGYAEFVSVQTHYNLIYRETEKDMLSFCDDFNVAMTPYSALAAGRLSRHPGETSKRLVEDNYAKFKYDAAQSIDSVIISRVEELAEKYNVSMTEISLGWLLTKVASPVVGATKPHHIDGAVKAVDLTLSPEDISYLEEGYVPHALSGVMAQNKKKGN